MWLIAICGSHLPSTPASDTFFSPSPQRYRLLRSGMTLTLFFNMTREYRQTCVIHLHDTTAVFILMLLKKKWYSLSPSFSRSSSDLLQPTTLFPQQHLERLTLENPSVDATGGDKTELVTPGRKAFGEPGRPWSTHSFSKQRLAWQLVAVGVMPATINRRKSRSRAAESGGHSLSDVSECRCINHQTIAADEGHPF